MTSFLFLGVSVFQHTAARRRLAVPNASLAVPNTVSTHSRPKAAGYAVRFIRLLRIVSTHSRPKAAGYLPKLPDPQLYVSTHSRPKAAGFSILTNTFNVAVSTHSRPKAAGSGVARPSNTKSGFNTQPPEGGWRGGHDLSQSGRLFQHTAARRRLVGSVGAGFRCFVGFNTQPPKGGWLRLRRSD